MVFQVLFAFVIFLFPLALYSLVLAHVNRARRPMMVSGLWDCIGLLFGLSGFLLWSIPWLLREVSWRVLSVLPGGFDDALIDSRALVLGIAYYLGLVLAVAFMMAIRRHKTVIYNVETVLLRDCIGRAIKVIGLDYLARGSRLVIAPAEAFSTPPALAADAIIADPELLAPPSAMAKHEGKILNASPSGPRYAEVLIDPFPVFCHATLHWESYTPAFRREIEEQLEQALENATAVDNPTAAWFLGFSGLIFGVIAILAAFFLMVVFLSRR